MINYLITGIVIALGLFGFYLLYSLSILL